MKKFLLLVLVIFIAVLVVPSVVRADPPFNTAEDTGQAQDDFVEKGDVSSPVHVADVETARQATLVCQMIGKACSKKKDAEGGYLRNSVLGMTSNAISYLYLNKPADTAQFIAYYGQKMGIVRPAYAQGIGFSGLSPILGLWTVFRNIAYGFIILILVVIGFMVMFRMKIDPRTVISVQNALPRIIITLILITFSYAIVGLLIDVMYLTIYIAMGAFKASNMASFPDFQQALTNYSGGPLTHLFGSVWTPGIRAVDDLIALIGGGTAVAVSAAVGAIIGGILLFAVIPFGGGLLVGAAAGPAVGYMLLLLIVAIAMIFAFVRIFVMLLSAYIQVIISLIFGPLQIMFGAIPNSTAFSTWFKNLLANLLVFPITSVLLLVALLLSEAANNSGALWVPPGLTGGTGAAVSGLIGLGMVLMIPAFVNNMKESFKAKPAIPAAPGGIFQPVGTIFGVGLQALSASYYAAPFIKKVQERLKPPTPTTTGQ